MSNREFCVARRKAEQPAFVKVLKAVPQAKLGYQPDPKARTAGDLAWMLAVEEQALLGILETGTVAWPDAKTPANVAEIVASYEKNAAAVTAKIEKLDDAGWKKNGKLMMGEAGWEDTIENMVWGFLFDAIHHRGQLTAYIRPMGGKVPGVYGRSGDEKPGA